MSASADDQSISPDAEKGNSTAAIPTIVRRGLTSTGAVLSPGAAVQPGGVSEFGAEVG